MYYRIRVPEFSGNDFFICGSDTGRDLFDFLANRWGGRLVAYDERIKQF